MPINELRSITTFVKTAELGSLRKAAATQGITPQAASQALAQLELHLGVRLFHRTTRNMSLTDEGRQFLDAAQPPLLSLQRAMQIPRRAKDEIAGPLRIVGSRSTCRAVLWSVLEGFCQLHPDVVPDVQLDDRRGNWVEDRVDVGFRIGLAAEDGVIARRLFPLQLINRRGRVLSSTWLSSVWWTTRPSSSRPRNWRPPRRKVEKPIACARPREWRGTAAPSVATGGSGMRPTL